MSNYPNPSQISIKQKSHPKLFISKVFTIQRERSWEKFAETKEPHLKPQVLVLFVCY